MGDQLDVPLEDGELLAEVELTTNLMIAATEAEALLPRAQVDAILGLDRVDVEPEADPTPVQRGRVDA